MLDWGLVLSWLGAIAGAAILLFGLLAWWARRTPNDIDDVVVGVLQWPALLILILTAIISLTNRSALTEGAKATINTVANLLRIGITTWAVWRLMRDSVLYYGRRLAQRSESSFDDVLVPVLDVLAPVVIGGVGAILMLRLLGADISTVVLTTGGAALIVGLALRDTLGNILGGLTLLIDTPFRFGDLIIWDGVVCQIRRIGLRVTTLYNTEEHCDIYVPNSVLAATKITNLTRPSPDLRVTPEVAVPDDVPLERAEAVLLEVADANPYILGDLPAKLGAMRRALAECDPKSPRGRELRWGISALRRERQLDLRQARMMALLDRLLAVTRGAEKGGLSSDEKAAIARELDALDAYDERLKEAMRAWARARAQDPQLRRFPADRARLLDDAERRIRALTRRTDSLRQHLKSPSLYETQRLDDLVAAFRDWLPTSFRPVTPAWKFPLVALRRASAAGRLLHLSLYVDDIHLEGFLRRPRAVTAVSEAVAARLRAV
ncbi:MAG: mechanosensitive ion channel [Anaerolineae bacterium]|nr:mechanosensitive ion channel [Anaerolineae bacterium]